MKSPAYYSNRLAELDREFDGFMDDGDYKSANITMSSISLLKNNIMGIVAAGGMDENDEASSTQRFLDAQKQYNDYRLANWLLFFIMNGTAIAYFRNNE